MASSTTQTALPTLPGELWDQIVDSLSLSSSGYCSNEDDTTLDALRALLHMSRSLRLRALYNLIRDLDLSPENGCGHLEKAGELLAMLKDDDVHSLRAMPRELSLDLLGNMLSGWLDILPNLVALRSLTIANGNLHGAGDAISVESLVLDECAFDTTFVARFKNLRRLELINCRAVDDSEVLPFLPGQCELYLHSPCEDVLDWVAQHVDGFVLRSLALTSTSAPIVPMDALHTLYLCAHNLDAEVNAISKCTSLQRLELVAPSVPRALLLFKAVRIVPDSCGVVALEVPEDGPYDELASAVAKWGGVRELWVKGCLVQPAPASHTSPDAVPIAQTLEPIELVKDSEETVEVVDGANPYAPPFELGVSMERTEDLEDEEEAKPAPRANPYAPPFALGVSTEHAIVVRDDDDEEEYDADAAPMPAPRNPYAPPFALGVSTASTPAQSDDEDDDGTTPSLTSDSGSELSSDTEVDSDDDDDGQEITLVFSRDAFKPPFALGVSRARVADDSEDDDGGVDLDMPTPRVDSYKPPFPLGVSTLHADDDGDDEEDVTVPHFDPYKPPFALGTSTDRSVIDVE